MDIRQPGATVRTPLALKQNPDSPEMHCTAIASPAMKKPALFESTRDNDAIRKFAGEVSMLKSMSPAAAPIILGFRASNSHLTKIEISAAQFDMLKITQECIDWVKERMPHSSNQLHGIAASSGESIWRGVFWEKMSESANLGCDHLQVGIDAIQAGSGNCNAYAPALLVKLMTRMTLPLSLMGVEGEYGHKHVFAVVGDPKFPDQMLIADAWPRNARACLLNDLALPGKRTIFAHYTSAEIINLRPGITHKLNNASTVKFTEVQKKVLSSFSAFDMPPPGKECLRYWKKMNADDPGSFKIYDCDALVKNVLYHDASKMTFFDPVGTSRPFSRPDLGPVAQFGKSPFKN
jgi:hypothetical protein